MPTPSINLTLPTGVTMMPVPLLLDGCAVWPPVGTTAHLASGPFINPMFGLVSGSSVAIANRAIMVKIPPPPMGRMFLATFPPIYRTRPRDVVVEQLVDAPYGPGMLGGFIDDLRELIGFSAFDHNFNNRSWQTDAVNYAFEMCAALLGLTATGPASISVTDKTVQIPDGCISVIDVVEPVMGKILRRSTIQIENQKNPRWRSRTGEPTVYIEFSGEKLLLNGQPGSGSVMLTYIERPVPMVNLDDTPDPRIPEVFHQHMKYAAASRLLELAGSAEDVAKSDEFFRRFAMLIGAGDVKLARHTVDR